MKRLHPSFTSGWDALSSLEQRDVLELWDAISEKEDELLVLRDRARTILTRGRTRLARREVKDAQLLAGALVASAVRSDKFRPNGQNRD